MRQYGLALCGLLLAPGWMWAQQPPAVDAKLEGVLAGWERGLAGLRSVVTTCRRTEISKALRTVDQFEGQAKLLKSDLPNQPCKASLYLEKLLIENGVKKNNKEIYEKVICTGNFVYIFDPTNKVMRIADQPTNPGGIGDNQFMSFLFDMKAADAKLRYQIILVKTDEWYHYLRILPRTEKDKQSFVEARVCLLRTTYMPRQLWYQHSNGNETTWDFPNLQPNGQVSANDFAPPNKMPGWREERIQPKR